MSWLVFAFSGPVLWAISVHLDKYLVDRYFKNSSVAVLLVFTAFIGLALLPFIVYWHPEALILSARNIAVMMIAGLLYMGAMYLYLQALQSEEASVVAPFFQTSPLFAYALGYLVLGETLTGVQLAGGALIIGGALLLSIRAGIGRVHFKARVVTLMLINAFALAVSTVIFKALAIEQEFWTTTFWLFVGEAVFGAALLCVPSYRNQFQMLVRTNTGPLLTVNAANELINLGGGLGARYALMFAPLSLVQAIGSTTTLFVFLIGTALSLLAPQLAQEDLSPRNLAQKAVSAVLIGVGVALVNG
jgi:drug/metabolite transporter (DMT)-like permease